MGQNCKRNFRFRHQQESERQKKKQAAARLGGYYAVKIYERRTKGRADGVLSLIRKPQWCIQHQLSLTYERPGHSHTKEWTGKKSK